MAIDKVVKQQDDGRWKYAVMVKGKPETMKVGYVATEKEAQDRADEEALVMVFQDAGYGVIVIAPGRHYRMSPPPEEKDGP